MGLKVTKKGFFQNAFLLFLGIVLIISILYLLNKFIGNKEHFDTTTDESNCARFAVNGICKECKDGYVHSKSSPKKICVDMKTNCPYIENYNCVKECSKGNPFVYIGKPSIKTSNNYLNNNDYKYCYPSCPFNSENVNEKKYTGLDGKTCLSINDSNCPYVDGKNCVSSCPNFIDGKKCVSSCPQDKPYNDDKKCVSSCSNFIDGKNCVSTCPNFINGKYCVSNCPNFIDGKNCVSSCPQDKPYKDDKKCVSSCPANNLPCNNVCTSCNIHYNPMKLESGNMMCYIKNDKIETLNQNLPARYSTGYYSKDQFDKMFQENLDAKNLGKKPRTLLNKNVRSGDGYYDFLKIKKEYELCKSD